MLLFKGPRDQILALQSFAASSRSAIPAADSSNVLHGKGRRAPGPCWPPISRSRSAPPAPRLSKRQAPLTVAARNCRTFFVRPESAEVSLDYEDRRSSPRPARAASTADAARRRLPAYVRRRRPDRPFTLSQSSSSASSPWSSTPPWPSRTSATALNGLLLVVGGNEMRVVATGRTSSGYASGRCPTIIRAWK